MSRQRTAEAAGAMGRWLPGVATARRYDRRWLRDDVIAGLALTAVLVPTGIGYAQAAGLPPETGLYSTVVPMLAYAIFGPSRILVVGPDSALVPIIAASVLPHAARDEQRAVALAGLLAIMMGTVLIAGGLLRLGFVTDLLSKPIRIGYLNGIAAVVIVSQLPKLLGFAVDSTSVPGRLRQLVEGIDDGAVVGRAAGVGLAALGLTALIKLRRVPVPAIAVAVAGSALMTAALGWEDDVPVVGSLPRGLPSPRLGSLEWSDVGSMAGPALGLALIAFADSSVLSRTFASRHGESVDANREMVGIGAASVAGGALGGFPVSASTSRTPVAESAGARTQLTGVVGALLIVVFVVAAPGATRYLPESALAAVVIVAAASLVDLRGFSVLLRDDGLEAALSIAAFVGVVTIGVLEGIAIAIGLSLIAFVNRAWRPYRAELGRVRGLRGYHDMSRHDDAARLPGIVIVRFDAPLFFANGSIFDAFVRSKVRDVPGVHTVILAAAPITDIDTTAVEELVELDDFLASRGIMLLFAEMKGPVKDQLHRYRLGDRFAPERFFPTVGAAVDAITGEFRGDLLPP